MHKFRFGVAIAAAAAALVGVGPSVALAAPHVAATAVAAAHPRAVTPDAYPPLPSDCQFSTVILRDADTVVGDGLVVCDDDATSIGITLTIQRSRFYGWQTMKSEELEVHNTDEFLMFLKYNCAGTGTHNFRLIGTAWMLYKGTLYQSPSITKQMSNVSC